MLLYGDVGSTCLCLKIAMHTVYKRNLEESPASDKNAC